MDGEKLEEYLSKISIGLTPEMVQLKSQELREEYGALVEDTLESIKGDIPEDVYLDSDEHDRIDDDVDDMCFKSWVGHKFAAIELVLNHIVKVLNDAAVENGEGD